MIIYSTLQSTGTIYIEFRSFYQNYQEKKRFFLFFSKTKQKDFMILFYLNSLILPVML